MADKCFCHLNGFEVKDARARKSIEELTATVEEVTATVEDLQKNGYNPIPVEAYDGTIEIK